MEATSLSCSFSLYPKPKTFSNLQNPSHLSSPFPSPSPSSARSYKLGFSKTHLDLKLVLEREGARKVLQCKNNAENNDFIGVRDDSGFGFRRKRLAVFVSGGGSNFRSIHEAICQGQIHADIVVLVTDKPSCGGAEYARVEGIPIILFPKTSSSPEGLAVVKLVAALQEFEIDFILLAGYLKLIPVELIRAYPRSILNIHPSLLPSFGGKGYYGLKVHEAVIASGARYSGPTVHFVDEQFDMGRILAQRVVPVLANDTAEELAARVLCEEHQLYPDVVSALCEERIVWREDGVPLIQNRGNPNEYS